MSKSSKDKSKNLDLQTKAKQIFKKKTGWDTISISLVENRVKITGEVLYKYTGINPKDKTLASVFVYVDKNGKEVDFQEKNTSKNVEAVSTTQFLEKIEKTDDKDSCERIANYVDDYLTKYCQSKFNALNHCDVNRPNSSCTKNIGGREKVDLVILIDTSGSMSNIGVLISKAAITALEQLNCHKDLKITWLGIAGTFSGTNFLQTSNNYLTKLGCTSLIKLPTTSANLDEDKEEGARTIINLSNCFDWRRGACRSIFYISDEAIHRGDDDAGDQVQDDIQTANAIDAAQANNVTVFAHYLKKDDGSADVQNYKDLCNATGGMAFIDKTATEAKYIELLNHAICNACGSCKTYEWQKIEPCFSIAWGDSDCDCLETDDFEVLCINVCNCYNNVTFEDVKIGCLYLVDEHGRTVPNLPDGTPSVEIYPLGPICFGDLAPCEKNVPTCVSRQVILRARGAKKGKYSIRMKNICYQVSHSFSTSDCFEFELCKD